MGRPRSKPRSRAVHIRIPEDILAQVDEKLFDPYRGKPLYGGYAFLVSNLLRKWLEDPGILPIELVEEPVENSNE